MLDWYRSLREILPKIDHAALAEYEAKGDEERAAIQAAFPQSEWPTLPLERYAQGLESSEPPFCTLLEQRSHHLGRLPSRGAKFHNIFFHSGSSSWWFPESSGFADEREAWDTYRRGYVEAFELAERGEYAAIDRLDVFTYRTTLHKALHVYFPDKFLPVSATSHLTYFAKRLFRSTWRSRNLKRLGHCALNELVFDTLRQVDELKGRSSVGLMFLLYDWAHPQQAPNVYKIAPGRNARFWEDCLRDGYICVGWDEVGDLRDLEWDEYQRTFRARYQDSVYGGNKSTTTKKLRELWQLRNIAQGSLILANKGTRRILAVGEVQDPGYRWIGERTEHKHVLQVDWDTSLSRTVPKQGGWPLVTVKEIDPTKFDEMFGSPPDLARFPWEEGAGPEPTDGEKHWIFQADPRLYDLVGALSTLESSTWRVSRYTNDIEEGDRVLLWASGPEAGVYGLATVTGAPRTMPLDDDPFVLDDVIAAEHLRVPIEIDRALDRPLYRTQLLDTPGLEDLQILRAPQGTNFKVEPEEAAVLMKLIEKVQPAASFEGILTDLRRSGLHFEPELVANFLLALQSKRFVILTGISGTGKTQLALSVAKRFRATRRVPKVTAEGDSESAVVEVKPYMLKYRRLILPAALAARVTTLAEVSGSGKLQAHYPGGSIELTVWQRNATQVLFKGDMRAWFERELSLGDQLVIGLTDYVDDEPTAVRFEKAQLEAEVERELPNYAVVAVRPDWTDNRGLLGYYNPLTERYVTTPFLRVVLDAANEAERAESEGRPPHPFFVILDEMNLARVEHYFSDFLSCLESEERLDLHDELKVEDGEVEDQLAVPRKLSIPSNLFFVGTVNVDETTYMFSPKVLDRAFTIELNEVDLAGFGVAALDRASAATAIELDRWDGTLEPVDQPGADDWLRFSKLAGGELKGLVLRLHDLLAAENRHFGYRVANEIARFVTLADEQSSGGSDTRRAALDLAILQKVLPKLNGTQQELQELIDRLFAFAVLGHGHEGGVADPNAWRYDLAARALRLEPSDRKETTPVLPRTALKLWRMRRRLVARGFTSYIE